MKEKIEGNTIQFTIDRKIYPMEVLFGACFNFIDKCYVYIDKSGKDDIEVTLKGKTELGGKDLEAISGEFHNELLNQALRKKINQSNKRIREYIVSRALFSAVPVDDVDSEFDEPLEDDLNLEEDFLDDPLQIAVPWDEKYGDKKKDAAKDSPEKAAADTNTEDHKD